MALDSQVAAKALDVAVELTKLVWDEEQVVIRGDMEDRKEMVSKVFTELLSDVAGQIQRHM